MSKDGSSFLHYRGYQLRFDPPPIPDRRFDWQFVHESYDGDGDPRHGYAPSLEAAKAEIDEQVEDTKP